MKCGDVSACRWGPTKKLGKSWYRVIGIFRLYEGHYASTSSSEF